MRAHKTVALAAMALALAACGGGGGGGGSSDDTPEGPQAATADISGVNYTRSADGAAAATTSGLGNLALFTGGGVVAGAATGRAAAAGGAPRLAMGKLLSRNEAQASGRAHALAVFSDSEPCSDGGSLLFTLNEADPDTTTPGDSVTVTAQNCVEGGVPIVGGFKLTVSDYAETQTQVTVSFLLALDDFGVPELNFNGKVAVKLRDSTDSFTVRLAHQGVTASGTAVAPVQWYHTVAYSLDVGSGRETVSFSGFVGVNGGFVRLDQLSPFVLTAGQPGGGELQITGANGGRVIIVAGATRFDYEFYAASNTGTVPDAIAPGLEY